MLNWLVVVAYLGNIKKSRERNAVWPVCKPKGVLQWVHYDYLTLGTLCTTNLRLCELLSGWRSLCAGIGRGSGLL